MFKNVLLGLLGGCASIGAGTVGYLYLRTPEIAPPVPVQIEMTEERAARGKHLFENVAGCDGCHSPQDFSRAGGPVVAYGRGQGGVFPSTLGLPGRVVAPNLTPDRETGLGNWTDGEKIRAIREGIGKDGRALFPLMPYGNYRNMSDEDVYALVVYLNMLTPIRNELPKTELQFPASQLIKSLPRPVGLVRSPDARRRWEHGRYLATLAGCVNCHTQEFNGQLIESKRLAGGRTFRYPHGTAVSPNITPDGETGIGRWTEADFIAKFRRFRDHDCIDRPRAEVVGFTVMPWSGLAGLSNDELSAIWSFLRAQPAVRNVVVRARG